MARGQIHLTLPAELVKKIDSAAKEEFASRSEFIRLAIMDRLQYVAECRARLTAIATTSEPATEDELYKLLRLKHARREVKKLIRGGEL